MRRVLTVLGVLLGLTLAAVAPVLAVGDAEVGMVDTNTGRWHLREPDGSDRSFFYGNPGDIPVLGDWDCDGVDTPGMFRPANGFFYLTNNNPPDGGVGVGEISFFFGIGGDLPLVGDWDGDGCDTVGIYRNGQAFLTNGLVTAAAELQFYFGVPGDRPFAGDWDGDGTDTIGIYRDSRGQIFYTNENPAGPVATTANDFFYGIPSDRFMPGDWNGDGIDTVGIFRPTESRFYLRNVNSTGPADETIDFGQSSWTPLGGDHELREASLSAPASIEPGPVGVNGIGTTTFNLGFVGDSGDADIRVTEVTFFGPDADELSVAPISDADIGFGESRTVEITIAPKVVGVRRSYVRIEHTGVGSPLIIPVVGEGSYRVNAGGDPIEDWSADDPFSPGGSVGPAAATTVSGPTAPDAVFESYRFGQQAWDFPVTPGSYRVNLYFAETFSGTQSVGARQFDVTIEGTEVLTNFDIFASAGANNGIVRTFDVFSDANLDIDLTQVVNSPAIQGIEIIPTPSWKTIGSSPSTAVFGSIAVGDAISRTITVVHAGEPTTASVNLQAATVVGSDSGEFSILSGGAARTLAAGGSTQVVVEYRPASAGVADARLFIAHDGPNSPLEVDLIAAADDVILYRLNAGGDAVIGQFSWIADDPYLVPGTPSGEFALVEAINTSSQSLPPGTPLDVLRTERFGSTFQALSYDLPLANGAYEVRLYLVEPVHTAAGVRVFDVNVEGALAINDLDIYARAGKNKAIMIPVRANVTGGVLDIDLIPIAGKNLPAIHGIEVVREVGTAVLDSDPVSLTLGPISAAGSTTGEVEIVHTGGAGNPSIVIDSVSIGGPNALRFQLVSGVQAGDVFPAGTSAPTVIRFTAGWPGEKAATLEITYNGGASLTVPLVGSVNDPPVVPTLVNQSVNEGVAYSRTIVATDPDADFLTMTATGLPAWASITTVEDGTITIGGTPGFEDAGSSSVSVTATDPDGAADTESFTLTVTNVNRAPTFNQNLGNRSDSEGDTVSVASEATDLDGNVLTWSATGLPQGITINSTSGLMTGTIGFLAADNQPGGGYSVVVTVRDNGSPNLTDTDSFQWTITDLNRPPTANNVGPGVLEGGSVTFTVTGSDPDGDSLTFALFGGGPSNGTITAGPTQVTATSASITYLHDGSETLSDSFQFTVNDGTTTSAPATVSVVVTPQNDPPVATATAPAGGFETQSVAFSGSGSDVDGTIASYSWTFGDGGTSTLPNPTHVYASAGTYNGSLVVTDNGGAASAPDPFTIVIDDLFLLTVEKAGTGTGTVTGVGISCGGDCSDLYRSGLDVTLSAAPDAGSSFAGWSGVPGCAGTGDCTITMSADTTVTATFNDIPQPPVANDASPGVLEGGSVTFTVTGSDPDGDSLTFALFGGGPSNGTITAGPTQVTATSASITYLHDGSETLSDSFQFTVNDGTTTSAPATVSVVVTPQNDPPVATATAPAGGFETQSVAFSGSGSDVDGTIASYSWTFGDGGTSTLQNPTHVYASAGTYNGSLVVTDNGGAASAPDPFTIVIDDLFLLTVEKAGTGTGTVTGVGISCGGDCSDLYRSGLDVTLSAAPDAGSSFAGWSGVPGCAGTGDCTITMSADTTVTATFNDIPQPPVANDASPGVLEGGSVTFTVTGSDPDGDSLTFALFGGGPSNGTITAGPTQVTATSASITYLHDGSETLSDSFQFTVNDGTTTSAPATVSIVVTPVNEAPSITTGASHSAAENQTAVTDVNSSDPEGETEGGGGLVYSLSGADSSFFSISAGGLLTFDAPPDFESPGDSGGDNVYNVTVTVTDSGALTDVVPMTVEVTDVSDTNLAPSITTGASHSAAENQTAVTDVNSSDPEGETEGGGGLVYSLSGADSSFFSISAGGLLTFDAPPDFESPGDSGGDNVYNVTVTVTDSGALTDVVPMTVTVTNVNEAPSITTGASHSAAENQTAVTDVNSSDPEGETEGGGGLVYSLSGADSSFFSISAGGLLTFDAPPDFESPGDSGGDNVYNVTVTVTDSGALTDVVPMTVEVTDVSDTNLAPSITTGASHSAAENQTAVTDVNSSDPEGETEGGGGLVYSLSGADSSFFSISAGGLLTFDAPPDFESPGDSGGDNVYNVTVTVTDSGALTDVVPMTVTVTNVNEAPSITTGASHSAAENQTAVTDVNSSDPEGETEGGGGLVYSLSGADSSFFSISAGGLLTFDAPPDFESPGDSGGDNVYNVTVTVTDSGALTDVVPMTVEVTDVSDTNLAPSITTGASHSAAENQTAVTDVNSSDPEGETEGGGGLVYSLSGADSSFFSISAGGLLTFDAPPDFESPGDSGGDNVYNVTVTVTDSGALTDVVPMTVTVTNVNEAPSITTGASHSAAENQTAVTDVNSSDPEGETEGGGGLVYSLSGADSSFFSISAGGLLTFDAPPDFESPGDSGGDNVYNVTVTVTDSGALTDVVPMTVEVTDVEPE